MLAKASAGTDERRVSKSHLLKRKRDIVVITNTFYCLHLLFVALQFLRKVFYHIIRRIVEHFGK